MKREQWMPKRITRIHVALTLALLPGVRPSAADELVDPATYPALPCVLAIAMDENVPLAIDPDVIAPLTTIRTRYTAAPDRPGLDELAGQLQSHEMVIVPVQLTPKLQVRFLTMRAMVVYCAAVGQLKRGDVTAARRALDANFCDHCEFAVHCRELRSALDELAARRHAIACLAVQARQSIEKLGVARSAVTTATAASLSNFRSSESIVRLGPDLKVAFEASSRARHAEEMRRGGVLLERLRASAVQSKSAVMPRIGRAMETGLLSEGCHLAEALAEIHAGTDALRGMMRREGAGIDPGAEPGLPADLAMLCVQLRQSMNAASSCVRLGMVSIDNKQATAAMRQFSQAFAADHGDPLARIGLGYCLVQKYGMELGPYCPELMPATPGTEAPSQIAGNHRATDETPASDVIAAYRRATR